MHASETWPILRTRQQSGAHRIVGHIAISARSSHRRAADKSALSGQSGGLCITAPVSAQGKRGQRQHPEECSASGEVLRISPTERAQVENIMERTAQRTCRGNTTAENIFSRTKRTGQTNPNAHHEKYRGGKVHDAKPTGPSPTPVENRSEQNHHEAEQHKE